MQRLSWDVIRTRATNFAAEWAGRRDEKRDTQTFYNEFFQIFGVDRKRLATYEMRVELLAKKFGFIDLFWPGVLLVEQKTSFLDLDKAGNQALAYIDALPDNATPRYLLTCDFHHWRLRDLAANIDLRFTLDALPQHIEAFAFMLGRRGYNFGSQPAVNIAAAELMGRLHTSLERSGYTGHDLERLLVRLLFCMFADDTGIFEPRDIFLQYLAFDTRDDGSDLGEKLNKIFDVLDTEPARRSTLLRDELRAFAYVNGALFAGSIRAADFDKAMREDLLDACRFDWSKVSPAIFGSLFQSVMAPGDRRKVGAHYTSEANILKVIGPLFLDDLRAEFAALKRAPGFTGRGLGAVLDTNRRKLTEMLRRLQRMNFLDPACGCGNFLVVAYRELRGLELDILRELFADEAVLSGFDGAMTCQLNVDQFHGIEIGEFPAQIARVSMWTADHLANNAYDAVFGLTPPRIPLKQSANIAHGDALALDWNAVLPAGNCSFVMGNPPFVGQSFQKPAQRAQMATTLSALGGSAGSLDYVTAWFVKAVAYLGRSQSLIAFVATNSICQGEQVAQLWPVVFRAGYEIAFAHRSFIWDSEARGKAHVHVVIVGLAHRDAEPVEKRLFNYDNGKGAGVETRHAALPAYLFEARTMVTRHLTVRDSRQPLTDAPAMRMGSKVVDGGHYIFSAAARSHFLQAEPDATRFMVPLIGSIEFIHGAGRFILSLTDADPDVLAKLPRTLERIAAVQKFRLCSKKAATRKLAIYPREFEVTTIPQTPFLVVPEVSSERRDYVPIGWLNPPTIPSNLIQVMPDATPFDFGILTSRMHMAWLSHIGGRLKSDYRYSIGLVYNTFPWPAATEAQRAKVAALADAVLAARANHPTANLAILYDPLTMPADLRAAHTALDRAVDRLYRAEAFGSDRDRVEHLFTRYAALVDPLATAGVRANARVARRAARAATSA